MATPHTKRIIRSGFRNFVRSGFTSIASVLVMTITLFVITSLVFLQAALNASLVSLKDKVDISIYFVPGTTETAITNVKLALEKLPEVQNVTYTSQDQALLDFKDKHANDYLTLQALDELSDNPLGAMLSVRARDPSQYESISKYFDTDTVVAKGALTIIDKIDYHRNKLVIDRLTAIMHDASRLGFAVTLVLVIVSVLITFNTIRLIIYMSREEIGVMRLVGARKGYIRGPFIVTGIIVGFVASVLTLLICLPICIWLGNQISDFIGINLFTYYKQNIFQLWGIMVVAGVGIGSLSSILAVGRYLKK